MSGATQPQGTTAAVGNTLADRMVCDLQPLLAALAMLTNCVRVLDTLQAAASVSPELCRLLGQACPTWSDPVCMGGEASAQSVVCELARYAAGVAAEMATVAMNGGDE